jgi:hypothetical protein
MARWLVVGIGEVERPVDGGVVLAGGGACCAYATGALSELLPRYEMANPAPGRGLLPDLVLLGRRYIVAPAV